MSMNRTLALANPCVEGKDVVDAQEELNKFLVGRKLARALKIDGCFGPATAHHSSLAKYYLGYPERLVKPTYGATLDNFLRGTTKLPYLYSVRSRRRIRRAHSYYTRINELRSGIISIAKWGVENKADIHYSQLRPIDGVNEKFKLPLYIDCSGFVTLCYKWAGAPDPNGLGYNGYGYTGSLLNHMHHITREQVRQGDVVVFGAFPGVHTCVAADNGGTQLYSHGTEADPNLFNYDDMANAMPKVVSWLTLPRW